jgi:hypothetical protein
VAHPPARGRSQTCTTRHTGPAQLRQRRHSGCWFLPTTKSTNDQMQWCACAQVFAA